MLPADNWLEVIFSHVALLKFNQNNYFWIIFECGYFVCLQMTSAASDKTFLTLGSIWRQMTWHSACVNQKRENGEDMRDRGWRSEGERSKSGEKRSKCHGCQRGVWSWVWAPPCGERRMTPADSPEPSRDRDVSLIFHIVNKMILPCRLNTHPPIVISPKYTQAPSQSHNQIPTELYLATAYKHTVLFSCV